ncbi:MAG: hypothetical protein QG646_3140 [Euryarchaeota archaeon]|nr:hypothetical protein [Euryarchaeota archaeon]
MRNHLRKSGIDIIGHVPWGTHICQFFQTKDDLTDIHVNYLKEGLENNEFCLWVTSQPLEIEDAKESLRSVVPDLNIFLERQQIEIISFNDWFLTDGAFDPEKVSNGCAGKLTYVFQNGYEGFRLCVNNSWLDKEYWDSFIKFKEQMDNVIGNCQMLVLCTYSLEKHNVDEILDLGLNHQFTLINSKGKWKLVESYRRKMAEEAVVKATKDWEYTFDAVPDLISIIDNNYKIIRTNKVMAAKLGMAQEECIGLTCYHVVHGTAKPPSFCPQQLMLKDGLEHSSEICGDCLDGYFLVRVSPIYDSNGKLTGSIHVARDINERRLMEETLRQSEEKYRNIVETANEGIFLTNAELKVIYANKRTAEMLKYSPDKIIGKPVIDFISEESMPTVIVTFEKKLQGIDENYELKLKCKDGSPLWAIINEKTLFDKEGRFTGILGMLTDINNRKQTEIELLESETHFRTLAVNSPDIIARFDRQYRHIYVNPSAVVSYGIPQAEIIGKTLGDLGKNTKNVKVWEEHLENVFVTGKAKTIEYYILLKGKKYYFNTKIVPEFLNDKIVSVLTISRDITDIKESESRLKETLHNLDKIIKERTEELQKAYDLLKESERGLADAQEMAHIGNWERDLATNKLRMSDEIYRIFRINPQELYVSFDDVLTHIHPDDRDKVKKAFNEAFKSKSFSFDTSIILDNGEERIIHVKGEVVFDENNYPVRLKGTTQDISERVIAEKALQESEEKYRSIVETANEGIVIINEQFKATYVNQKMADMVGYSIEACLNKPIMDFISEESIDVVKNNFGKRPQGINDQYEFKLRRKDDSTLCVISSAKSLFNKEGRFIGSLSMLTDVTQKKKTEEELANIEIARKKEIHHRIKNNLQVISSLLDLQADKFKNKEHIRYCEVLDAFKESQDRVISMALIHEELYKGGGFEKLNFSPYAEELAGNILKTYNLGNNNVCLKLNLEANIFFDMDVAVPLGIIINELVSNSFKHAFKGRSDGNIQIKLHREEIRSYFKNVDENSFFTTFTLRISDNGTGIPANLDISALDSLGLQLVTSLVSQLDGELEIKRNNGTEFMIRFTVTEKKNQMSIPVSQQKVDKTCI